MSQPVIVLTDCPAADDVAVISAGLDTFNVERAGFNDRRDLAVLVRDPETRRAVGGLVGRTSLGLLFIDLFHLPVGMRGAGLGSEVLRQAEDEGRRRGCRTAGNQPGLHDEGPRVAPDDESPRARPARAARGRSR